MTLPGREKLVGCPRAANWPERCRVSIFWVGKGGAGAVSALVVLRLLGC